MKFGPAFRIADVSVVQFAIVSGAAHSDRLVLRIQAVNLRLFLILIWIELLLDIIERCNQRLVVKKEVLAFLWHVLLLLMTQCFLQSSHLFNFFQIVSYLLIATIFDQPGRLVCPHVVKCIDFVVDWSVFYLQESEDISGRRALPAEVHYKLIEKRLVPSFDFITRWLICIILIITLSRYIFQWMFFHLCLLTLSNSLYKIVHLITHFLRIRILHIRKQMLRLQLVFSF